jgi:pimeloyl-ACP methyl ester carboxylesterase
MSQTIVETPDGRRLRVEVHGDRGRVIVVHTGSPNGGVVWERWAHDAVARGLTLVSYDRPGYGGSTRQEWRTVADCAADVRAIARSLGFDRCATWGVSGGGAHALACAAVLGGDLVTAAVSIGGPAPFDAPGLDYFEGQSDAAREDHELFLSDRGAWELEGAAQREQLLALSPAEQAAAWSQSASPNDVADLSGEFGLWLYRAVRTGLEPGLDGWIDDDIAMRSPWGCDVTKIAVPVKIYHGHLDHFVPFGHGQWLANHIPTATAELSETDGHVTVVARRIAEVHEWLTHYV